MDAKTVGTSIVRRLFEAGYTAYFAGGFVRDLLLGQESEEIDIATSAPPGVVQRLFPKTLAIGISFGVIVVVEDGLNFEVSTFRKDHPYKDGRHPDGVDFSTPEKDAQRRDFSINGMFFDPLTGELHDFVGGQEDLKRKVVRAIGDPNVRFEEDRLRMIRAVRFANRFEFVIEDETLEAIKAHAHTLFPAVSVERVWQELSKMAAGPNFAEALLQLKQTQLLKHIFPDLGEIGEIVQRFPYFPQKTPLIIYIQQLMPEADFEQICAHFKTSKEDLKLAQFFQESEAIEYQMDVDDWRLAHFFAHRDAQLFLDVKPDFPHLDRRVRLSEHVQRLIDRRPVVTSKHLIDIGIEPGKQMGELLLQAERIAINEDLHEAEEVLARMELA